MNKIEKLAKLVLLDCLELQPRQSALLVSEVKQTHAALAFHSIAAKAHLELLSLTLAERPNGEPRLSAFSRSSLQAADLAIVILPKLDIESLNWLRQQTRTKVIVFSQIEDEAVLPSLETDPRQLRDRSRKLADILTIGRTLQLITNDGTSLKMSIAQNRGSAETIPLLPETYFVSLPLGRALVMPAGNSVEGEIVLTCLAGNHSGASSNVYLKVVDSRITLIKGGKTADELRRRLRLAGANARMIVEIGFGLNDKARLGNSEFEDAKVLGTAHLGFGRVSSGSKIPEIFARGILQAPTATIDGKKIIEQGKVLFG